jgi:hypothetical protein
MEGGYVLRPACEEPNGDHTCGYEPDTAPCDCACHLPYVRHENGRFIVELQPVDDPELGKTILAETRAEISRIAVLCGYGPVMESDIRTMVFARLMERGLKPKSYDEQILTLRYDPEHDSEVLAGHTVEVESLSRFANEVLHGVPGGDTLFPRLQEVRVEVSATD